MADSTEKKTISREEYDAVVAELDKLKESYNNLVAAFNKLMQEYNDMHLTNLFRKDS